jgi:predicted nucleotidyltransferase component of viral defense system
VGKGRGAALRSRYEELAPSDPNWLDAAGEYASTQEGRDRLSAEADEALSVGDAAAAARLRTALLRGEAQRAAEDEASRRQQASRGRRDLGRDEVTRVAAEFEVSTEQVLRDHAISHVLGALTTMDGVEDLVFFGGTALSRTFLPTLRLSEDIDLLVRGRRSDMAVRIEDAVARGLRRSHGEVNWVPRLADTSGSEAAVLAIGERIQIRVQLLNADRYPAWPTERRDLVQRYSDAPVANLRTLTATAFAAAKTVAWAERHAARDLYDLWALGEHGYIDAEAADLFTRLGPTGGAVRPWMFDRAPDEEAWQSALGHQGVVRVPADEALTVVRDRWQRATRPARPGE